MKKLLIALLMCVPISTFATTKEDVQIWVPVNVNTKFGDTKWRGFLELQPRFSNDASQLGTAIVRPAIGYAVTPKATVWAGYGMQASEIGDTNDYSIENRIWQGISWKDIYKDNLIWEVRNRLEQRFLPGNSDISVRWRTRGRVEYLTSINPVSVIASEEFFINLNDNDNNRQLPAGFNQNRAYVGLGYRFNPKFQVETGYLNQYTPGYVGKSDQSNHVWMTNLNLNF